MNHGLLTSEVSPQMVTPQVNILEVIESRVDIIMVDVGKQRITIFELLR